MMQRRILINRTSETVLRFLPPYILGKSHVDLAIAALDEVLARARDCRKQRRTRSYTHKSHPWRHPNWPLTLLC